MPFVNVERLPGEPIFITTYEGLVTAADIIASYEAAPSLWTDDLAQTGFHVIIDARRATTNFTEALASLRPSAEYAQKYAEYVPHIRYYVVGTGAMVKLMVNFFHLAQFGGFEIPLYTELDDALKAARFAFQQHHPHSAH
ncbi:MAG: hypothetical protein U0670_10860 [Anaerolineae bacterium]